MLLRRSPLIFSPNTSPIHQHPNRSTSRAFSVPRCSPIPCLRGVLALPALLCRASKRPDVAAVEVVTPETAEAVAVDGGMEAPEERAQESTPLSVGIGRPAILDRLGVCRISMGHQTSFLLTFLACMVFSAILIAFPSDLEVQQTSVAFTSLVIAAILTLLAMKRAAASLARFADTAWEELPSTMAAIRLSGMEISDLTLALSDLSQEIADGINKSAQAMQAAEAGIRQIGSAARRQTVSIIQERANLPKISLKPMVARAAKKTCHVVDQAKRTLMNIISGGEHNEEMSCSDDLSDKVEI